LSMGHESARSCAVCSVRRCGEMDKRGSSMSAQQLAFSREVPSAARASSGATTEFDGVDRMLVPPLPSKNLRERDDASALRNSAHELIEELRRGRR